MFYVKNNKYILQKNIGHRVGQKSFDFALLPLCKALLKVLLSDHSIS